MVHPDIIFGAEIGTRVKQRINLTFSFKVSSVLDVNNFLAYLHCADIAQSVWLMTWNIQSECIISA